MKPTLALSTMSLRQALPGKRTLLFALLECAPALIYLVTTTGRTEAYALEGAAETGAAILFALVLPVIAIVIASGTLGAERRDQTLSFIVLRPISRISIVVAKMAAAIAAASALNIVGAVLLAGAHAVRFGDTQLFVGLIVGVCIATTVYAAILVPLGFLTDRAVIVGMAYLLVFENGIANALSALASISPWRIGVAAFGALTPDVTLTVDTFAGNLEQSVSQSIAAAGVFVVIGVFTATILLRTRDLA